MTCSASCIGFVHDKIWSSLYGVASCEATIIISACSSKVSQLCSARWCDAAVPSDPRRPDVLLCFQVLRDPWKSQSHGGRHRHWLLPPTQQHSRLVVIALWSCCSLCSPEIFYMFSVLRGNGNGVDFVSLNEYVGHQNLAVGSQPSELIACADNGRSLSMAAYRWVSQA